MTNETSKTTAEKPQPPSEVAEPGWRIENDWDTKTHALHVRVCRHALEGAHPIPVFIELCGSIIVFGRYPWHHSPRAVTA
jgi:hypothetical protein